MGRTTPRIFETVLYAEDLQAAKRFYGEALGLTLVRESEVFLAFRLRDSALLVFNPVESLKADRSVPRHGADGPGHVAFMATRDEVGEWKARLKRLGVEIEKEVEWPEGGTSVYVRDPAGNSVEFAPTTLWGGGWD